MQHHNAGLDALIKRIERIYRLRLIYGTHAAIYGLLLAVFVLTYAADTSSMRGTNLNNLGGVLLFWLPILLAHTGFQVYIELREHAVRQLFEHERSLCYESSPAEKLKRFDLPVDFYDENGNPISGDQKIDFFPRQRKSGA